MKKSVQMRDDSFRGRDSLSGLRISAQAPSRPHHMNPEKNKTSPRK